MQAAALKAQLKAHEDAFPKSTQVRLHRALSWLKRAEMDPEDHDARFLFLWITFNAAYAQELGEAVSERGRLTGFLDRLLAVDHARRVHALLFETFSGPIRTLIDNRHVFEPFWTARREHDDSERWAEQFAASKRAALHAISNGNTGTVLGIVFDRLYTLRNQLVHGGATWNSSINRQQVRDGAAILDRLLPVLLSLMIEHPALDHGAINYPVV